MVESLVKVLSSEDARAMREEMAGKVEKIVWEHDFKHQIKILWEKKQVE